MNVSSASSSYVHPLSHVSLKFKLTRNERRHLDRFVRETKDNKEEYARGTAILMRWRGKKERKKVKDVARELNVRLHGRGLQVGESLQKERARWVEEQEAA